MLVSFLRAPPLPILGSEVPQKQNTIMKNIAKQLNEHDPNLAGLFLAELKSLEGCISANEAGELIASLKSKIELLPKKFPKDHMRRCVDKVARKASFDRKGQIWLLD